MAVADQGDQHIGPAIDEQFINIPPRGGADV
jgi:hypothetical protein